MAVGDQVTSIADGEPTRQQLAERVKIYRNDWEALLDGELSRQFVTETWERIKLMLDTSQNIFRRIIRETCSVYKSKVVRELVTPSDEGKPKVADVPIYNQRLMEMKFDWMMSEAQRIGKAAWVCFLRPRFMRRTGEMRLDIITPEITQVDLYEDDPLRMKGFGYRVTAMIKRGEVTEPMEVWVYYTDEKILYLDSSGREVANPFAKTDEDLGTENPYGVIPVIPFFCVPPTVEFWDLHWNKDAVRANYIIGVLNTYMNYLVKTQSFKQVAFTGEVSNALLSAISDPLFPLQLPEGTTAATLDLNTQLAAIDGVIRNKVIAIANNYGIASDNFTITGSPSSGYSLKIANRALEEIREQDKVVASMVEEQLFDLIRIINNTEGGEPIPEELELRFNPAEIEYPPTMAEEQSRWNFEFDNGISNAVDYLIKKDPELTREEAMEVLARVKEENEKIRPEPDPLETVFGGGKPKFGGKG
jgi:hypothetical protein